MVKASLFSNPALISYSDSLLEKRLSDPPWDMDTRAGKGIISVTVKIIFFQKKTTDTHLVSFNLVS